MKYPYERDFGSEWSQYPLICFFSFWEKCHLTHECSWIFFSLERVDEERLTYRPKVGGGGRHCRGIAGEVDRSSPVFPAQLAGCNRVSPLCSRVGATLHVMKLPFCLTCLAPAVLVCLSLGAVKVRLTQKRLGYAMQNHQLFNNKSKSLKIPRPIEKMAGFIQFEV